MLNDWDQRQGSKHYVPSCELLVFVGSGLVTSNLTIKAQPLRSELVEGNQIICNIKEIKLEDGGRISS